jgi:hypothetical protein
VIIAKAKKLLVKYPAGILPKASFFSIIDPNCSFRQKQATTNGEGGP